MGGARRRMNYRSHSNTALAYDAKDRAMHPQPRRYRPLRWLIVIIFAGAATAAFAHSGHRHEAEATAVPHAAEPRFSVETADLMLVGIVTAERLWLYADAPATNAPIDRLRIEVDLNGRVAAAVAQGAGRYAVTLNELKMPGVHTLVITVNDGARTQLLTGSLTVPAVAENQAVSPSWNRAAPILFAGCLVSLLAWRRLRATAPAAMTAWMLGTIGLCVVILSGVYIVYTSTSYAAVTPASPARPASAADAELEQPDTRSQRLSDGTRFVPKPAQTLLGLRTVVARAQQLPRSVILPGRIIPDPHGTVVVQAEQAGRLSPPDQGFPQPGARVAKGQLLAYLQPVVSSLDAARQRAELAALEKDLYLNKRQTERLLEQLGARDTTASVALEVGRAEQTALQRRIDLLRAALAVKLPMTAPMDGVIGASNAVNGAVMPAGGEVFSLVDPARFWVQVLVAAELDTGRINRAVALTRAGGSFPLAFAGHGYQLSNQALPLQFRPLAAMPGLPIGSLLDVQVQMQDRIDGVPVPRSAVSRSAQDAAATVWVRRRAEQFEARRVETLSLGDQRILVTSGLQTGDRIVNDGNALLSMLESTAR